MNTFILAYRSLLKKGQNNLIKILSLGVGLAVGLVLISKVFFDNSYDDFFPDSERIYQIQTNFISSNEPPSSWGSVSGAIAPGMKAEVPGVEVATRYTNLSYDGIIYTNDRSSYKATSILADTCFFDVLPRPMIVGNAKELLAKPMYAMVSKSLADRIGGDVIGKTIELDDYPSRELTIGGIFEDVPKNSHLKYDIIISLVSINNFTWDGTSNWIGNDRYFSYVKLALGVNPDDLKGAVRQMQVKNQNIEELERISDGQMTYSFMPLTKIHSDDASVKKMTIVMSAIAFALIFTAVMNYVLLVVTALVNRSKTIAIYKCYGAEEPDIMKIIFTEALLHLLISLALSVLLIFIFKGTIENIIGAPIRALFSLQTCSFLLGICLVILFVVGFIPSYLFSRIPVGVVFRSMKTTRNGWKVALLFIQVMATAFLVNLLLIVSNQYDAMVNDNPGYKYENVLYCSLGGVDLDERSKIIDELKRLSQVEMVSTSSTLFFWGASGNNVSLPNDEKELFNIADLYFANDNYFELMEVPIVEGKGFDKENSTYSSILISQSFADKISKLAGWTDGVIGKGVVISEHNSEETSEGEYKHHPNMIVGVYPNIRIGSITNQDMRPSVIFYTDKPANNIIIKMHELESENIAKVYNVFKTALPNKEVVVEPYKNSMIKLYDGSRLFRNAIVIGGVVALIITLIGLIGYTTNDVNRRKAEIAIRKINGATLGDILKLFMKGNLWISLPAIICGNIIATVIGSKWMEDFSEKVTLSPVLFLFSGITLLVIIISVVVFSCIRVANQNPVDSLKKE